ATRDSSEQVGSLLTLGLHAAAIYSVRIPDIREGDVLLVTAEAQVTDDLGINVFVGAQFSLADDPHAIKGIGFSRGNGTNVTPDIHHLVVNRTQVFRATRYLGSK